MFAPIKAVATSPAVTNAVKQGALKGVEALSRAVVILGAYAAVAAAGTLTYMGGKAAVNGARKGAAKARAFFKKDEGESAKVVDSTVVDETAAAAA